MEGEQNNCAAAAAVGGVDGGAVGTTQSGDAKEVVAAQIPSGE